MVKARSLCSKVVVGGLAALLTVTLGVTTLLVTGCQKSETGNATAPTKIIPVPAPSGAAPEEKSAGTAGSMSAPLPPGHPASGSMAMPPGHPGGGSMALPPGHGSMDVGKADALTPTPKVDAEIAKLEKSGKSKKELASLYAARGSSRMMDEHASPKVKYRAALQDYRQALKADPTNKEAQQNKALIESIYQGMGRPVPQ